MRTDEDTRHTRHGYAPARKPYHVHECPSDGMVFTCEVKHREGSIFLERQIVALHQMPHRRTW